MKSTRLAALLLVLSLLLSACGVHTQNASAPVPTEEEPTALSIMRGINTALPREAEDNYRSVYEVFIYSFYDSDGDGIGDLNGLMEKLDYINDGDPTTDGDLGCTGIWLMPIMPSPTYHKYDVTDYCAIDPVYGSLEDFKSLVSACHTRGVNIIIDLVMNHSSSQHPWFTQAVAYLQGLEPGDTPDVSVCPYVDYYNFSHETGGSRYPVSGTDWTYEAPFWSEMPDLNLSSEAVRAEFDRIVSFWLDLGVDGFRLDAAKEFYSGDPAANMETLSWFNSMVKAKRADAYIVAEVWNDLNTYAAYYASGIDSCFNFAFADSKGIIVNSIRHISNSTASSYGRAVQNAQETFAGYSDSYIDAPFYTNHDMGRSAGYYPGDQGESQVKMAQAMNLLMSGCSFLYYGEELGMKGSGKDENKRAPMFWSADPQAEGVCDGPQGMDEVAMLYPSLEEQQADGNSIYHFIVQTIRLRSAFPALSHGTAVFEENLSNEDVCILRKSYEGQELILIFNISDKAQSGIDLTSLGGNLSLSGVLLSTPESPEFNGSVLFLPPWSVAILEAAQEIM